MLAAVADIFQCQSQPRIMVGDPYQQIYAFRGAVNSMNLVTATHTFYLTQVHACWISYLVVQEVICTSTLLTVDNDFR